MIRLALALALALALTTPPAAAQRAPCGPTPQVHAWLAAQDLDRRATGISGGVIMEIWEGGGRFFVIATRADGLSCPLFRGEAWATHEPQPRGEPG